MVTGGSKDIGYAVARESPSQRTYSPSPLPRRGTSAVRWPVVSILRAGWAVATYYGGDVDFDDASVRHAGVRPYVDALPAQGSNPGGSTTPRQSDACSTCSPPKG